MAMETVVDYSATPKFWNVQFQKISILTRRKVTGNSDGVGDLESQNF
jgi:hypothetical protein